MAVTLLRTAATASAAATGAAATTAAASTGRGAGKRGRVTAGSLYQAHAGRKDRGRVGSDRQEQRICQVAGEVVAGC